jgi:hypothetical protein
MANKKMDTSAAPASEKIMIRFLLVRSANDPATGDKIILGRLRAIPVKTKGIAVPNSSNSQTAKPNDVRLDPNVEIV